MFPEILINQNIQAFFEFIYDRQSVWHKRTFLKEPTPWTDDKILQDFRFCNVYRELDGGTLAITKYLRQPLTPQQKLFNIIAYRFFNRRDTVENLFGGLLDPDKFDFKFLERRFDAQKAEGNIFSNAYLITAHACHPSYRPHDKHVQILFMLDELRPKIDSLLEKLRSSPAGCGIEILSRNIPMAGPFLAGQILLDCTYAGDIVPYTANDFLIVGPGAHWGLNIIFNQKLNKKEAEKKCRQLWQMQPQAFDELKARTGKDWQAVRWQNPAYCGGKYLCLHDIQNSLCEFRKYYRLKNGEKAKKRYYHPAKEQ